MQRNEFDLPIREASMCNVWSYPIVSICSDSPAKRVFDREI